jgi:hypothetical protein
MIGKAHASAHRQIRITGRTQIIASAHRHVSETAARAQIVRLSEASAE